MLSLGIFLALSPCSAALLLCFSQTLGPAFRQVGGPYSGRCQGHHSKVFEWLGSYLAVSDDGGCREDLVKRALAAAPNFGALPAGGGGLLLADLTKSHRARILQLAAFASQLLQVSTYSLLSSVPAAAEERFRVG